MRSFEERKEEIFRRSEQRIAQRKKTVRRVIVTCVPLALCLGLVSGYMVLGGFGKMDNAAPESAMEPNLSLQDSYAGDDAAVPECLESMAEPAVTAVSLQMQGGDRGQIYEDSQTLQQIQRILFTESYPETSGATDHTQQDPNENWSAIDPGKLMITFTYENGDSVLYTVTSNTVTGPEGSWKLTDEQCDQLIKLWSGEEEP